MVKGVLANLELLTYKYLTTDLNTITKIFFSRENEKTLKINGNIGVPLQVLWAMHLELHMLEWTYEFIFLIHIPLLQSCCHMTI